MTSRDLFDVASRAYSERCDTAVADLLCGAAHRQHEFARNITGRTKALCDLARAGSILVARPQQELQRARASKSLN